MYNSPRILPELFEIFSVMLQLYMNIIQDQPVQITFIYNSKEPPEVRKPLVILEPISGTLFLHIMKPTVLLTHLKSPVQHYSSVRKRTYQTEFRPTWIFSMLVCLNVSAYLYNMNVHQSFSLLEICNTMWSISDKMIIDTIAPALLLLHLNVVKWYLDTLAIASYPLWHVLFLLYFDDWLPNVTC